MKNKTREIETACVIAGGGPAGMMLGFLLARAGVDVMVLEKHPDFLRDFRGDTVHPSTLEIMRELGLLDEFLRLPHQKITEVRGRIGGAEVKIGDFTRLPTKVKFMAFMPQWDFLNFLAEKARAYPGFHLRMETEVTGLILEGDRIAGVTARAADGKNLRIAAGLVVGTDGRHSTVRGAAGLASRDRGSPIDVLWMRLPKRTEDPGQVVGNINFGRVLVLLDRGDYWQGAFVIRKGGIEEWQRRGLSALREALVQVVPFIADRVNELQSWDDIRLLTVTIDYLPQWWRPGLLCIGDAAHAMSPIGGVGINLAIQDAVAAANRLAQPLKQGRVDDAVLAAIQRRRAFPAYAIQWLQTVVQDRIFTRLLAQTEATRLPWPLRLMNASPWLRGFPARLLGLGLRREHVKTELR
jgi:2-polyprenyl-6-methoxyphenol hydroxylase-like FAD-dependent oxidoreductase